MKIRNNDLSDRRIDIDIADGVSIHLYKCEYESLSSSFCLIWNKR